MEFLWNPTALISVKIGKHLLDFLQPFAIFDMLVCIDARFRVLHKIPLILSAHLFVFMIQHICNYSCKFHIFVAKKNA